MLFLRRYSRSPWYFRLPRIDRPSNRDTVNNRKQFNQIFGVISLVRTMTNHGYLVKSLTSVPCIMICHVLHKATIVHHDLARLTMIMTSVPWLRHLETIKASNLSSDLLGWGFELCAKTLNDLCFWLQFSMFQNMLKVLQHWNKWKIVATNGKTEILHSVFLTFWSQILDIRNIKSVSICYTAMYIGSLCPRYSIYVETLYCWAKTYAWISNNRFKDNKT